MFIARYLAMRFSKHSTKDLGSSENEADYVIDVDDDDINIWDEPRTGSVFIKVNRNFLEFPKISIGKRIR